MRTEVKSEMTTIELNSSNNGSRIKCCEEKQQHIQHYAVVIKYMSTTGPIRGIEEAIRKLLYWKGEVLALEIFEGCIEPIVPSTSSDVDKQKYSMHMTPRDGLCQARGCNRQYNIETKMRRSSIKEGPDLFLCEYHFNKNRNEIRALKTKPRLSLIW
ncbi:MAG TPA: hypothetical protein VFI73_08660 [Candidatus Nitrosopolaris sp.]|nr:hypothetical protein [Candidatus Nitrosopolaris sp.]